MGAWLSNSLHRHVGRDAAIFGRGLVEISGSRIAPHNLAELLRVGDMQ